MNTWIELSEHEQRAVAPALLTEADGAQLHDRYGRSGAVLEVDWPSPKTQGNWILRAKGAVGALPLPAGGGVRVVPKVPLQNVFRMLEVAYDVDVRYLDRLVNVASIEDLFDRLAQRLVSHVLRRVRRGLIKDYQHAADRLPYVRGRLDVHGLVSGFDRSQVACRFDEHTADVHDNRVLVWTLHRLGRSAALRTETRRKVQRALYAIGPAAQVTPISAANAIRRTYDRLRQDYRPMHTICRFLLENAGPTHHDGVRETTAFLVQMPRLFERFVAEDLRRRLPSHLRLEAHEKVVLNDAHDMRFDIDLIVRERTSGRVVLVLDTKYKDHLAPDTGDVSQAVAYAVALGCEAAALVYPVPSSFGKAMVGRIPVWRLGVPLGGDLDEAGAALARRVVEVVEAMLDRHMDIAGS